MVQHFSNYLNNHGSFTLVGSGIIFLMDDCLNNLNQHLSKSNKFNVENGKPVKHETSLKISNKESIMVSDTKSFYLLDYEEHKVLESSLLKKNVSTETTINAVNNVAKKVFSADNNIEVVLFCINKFFLYGSNKNHCTGCNNKLGLTKPSMCIAIKRSA